MQSMVKGWVVCLCLMSLTLQAETFLNDPALASQVSEQGRGALRAVKGIEPRTNEQCDGVDANVEVSILSSPPRLQPVDPGFTPSHEVMRETEAKREANDRLWQSIFSVF